MGRFYSGDINGKFWFGIQSSDDISNLLDIDTEMVCEWYGCGCMFHDDNNEDNEYCVECYNNKDDFLLNAKEDMEADGTEEYYRETNEIVYDISSSKYLKPLEEKLNELEQKIHKSIIDAFKEITDDTSDTFSGVFDRVFELYDALIKEKEKVEEVEEAEVEVEVVEVEEAVEVVEVTLDPLDPELIARYTLGFQIRQHLLTNDNCCVYCEL